MAAPTQTYVDPSIAADSGSGTSGDPYGDLQYALNSVTRDSTNGDQFNIKAGTSELISSSLSLATYGTPGFDAPLIFRGYTSSANDGGVGVIDMQGNNASILAATLAVHWIDMHLTNTGSADVVGLGQYASIIRCEIDNSTGDGIGCTTSGNLDAYIIGCNIHNIAGYGIDAAGGTEAWLLGNYFANGTNDFIAAIKPYRGWVVRGNIITIDGTSDGIFDGTGVLFGCAVEHNSILSAGGTGAGISIVGGGKLNLAAFNNLIEGFSGSGGKGIEILSGTRNSGLYGYNAVYNCATEYDVDTAEVIYAPGDNESLGASPFAKSGSDTFANRFTYFAPVDTGNVRGGAYPTGARLDKGAVQHADPAGGGGSVTPPSLHAIESGIATG